MDLSMPVLDGVEATRQIGAKLPGTYVIALASHADSGLLADAMAAGAVGYLLKDCDPQDIVDTVRRARHRGMQLPGPRPEANGREDDLKA
jgi:DNA-binding NarL/FixJ family response regulator